MRSPSSQTLPHIPLTDIQSDRLVSSRLLLKTACRRGTLQKCQAKDKDVDRRAVDKSKILKEDPYGTIEDIMSENVVCVRVS